MHMKLSILIRETLTAVSGPQCSSPSTLSLLGGIQTPWKLPSQEPSFMHGWLLLHLCTGTWRQTCDECEGWELLVFLERERKCRSVLRLHLFEGILQHLCQEALGCLSRSTSSSSIILYFRFGFTTLNLFLIVSLACELVSACVHPVKKTGCSCNVMYGVDRKC